jgi:starch synthase
LQRIAESEGSFFMRALDMHVVFASSEAVPFAKTGGLADVCGALPLELTRLGVQTTLFLPHYQVVARGKYAIEPTGITLQIPMGNKLVHARILLTHLSVPSPTGSEPLEVPVYLIDQPEYFDRPGLYQFQGQDYIDNAERFIFFSRAVMEAIRMLSLRVDVINCNDWQTGLIPALLQIEYQAVPGFESAVSLMTVHNLAYQGNFWHWDMLLTGLDWKYFNWTQMEFHGHLNLLKTGLIFADAISTVSPTYAQEIQTAEQGCGLEGVLQNRREVLHGILNGIDSAIWNPATDKYLVQNYTRATVATGKAKNKAALQQQLGLPQQPNIPLVATVGRLAEQKGLDLIVPVLQQMLPTRDVQWVLLGTGDPKIQDQLTQLAQQYPQKIAVKLEFSEELAHRIEAAADLFLMPSRFEPCGLSQLYSLAYGTVPLVRSTGGLVDTVTDVSAATLANQTATGYQFREYHQLALADTIERALADYAQPAIWKQIVDNGLAQDWTWSRSAREYIELYHTMHLRAKKSTQRV